MQKIVSKIVLSALFFSLLMPLKAKAEGIEAGYLIKGENFSSVYFFDGMKRHAFPHENVYKSWYGDNFSNVVVVTDQELSDIPLGKNVTYRPGATMIKIQTVNTTYALDGNVIRPIANEEVARGLYGSAWNTMIRDVPDVFWTNYTLGAGIDDVSDFDPIETIKKYLTLKDLFVVESVDEVPVQSNNVTIVDELLGEIAELNEQIIELTPEPVVTPSCVILTTFYTGETGWHETEEKYGILSKDYVWDGTESSYDLIVPIEDGQNIGLIRFRSSSTGTLDGSSDGWTIKRKEIDGTTVAENVLNATYPSEHHYTFRCKNVDKDDTVVDVSIVIQ
ncbi:MAG: hypothetical protein WC346_07905 [Methanogenium sp.]|jgi:hypothetical protein